MTLQRKKQKQKHHCATVGAKKMANVSMKPRKKPAVKRNTAEKVGLRGKGPPLQLREVVAATATAAGDRSAVCPERV